MKKKIVLPIVAIILCIALIFGVNAFAGDGFCELETPVNSQNLTQAVALKIEDSKGR